MTLEAYLESAAFRAFQDENLREAAILAAHTMINASEKPIKKHQLHAISAVIQGGGLLALRQLADDQRHKNTNEHNKRFWTTVYELLSPQSSPEGSLYKLMESALEAEGFLESPGSAAEKAAQKAIKKRNNTLVEGAVERVLAVYFEHFTCHYFYKA